MKAKPFWIKSKTDSTMSTVIIMFVLFLVYLATAPIAIIWALNALFSLDIAVTFTTWTAVLVLWIVLTSSIKMK